MDSSVQEAFQVFLAERGLHEQLGEFFEMSEGSDTRGSSDEAPSPAQFILQYCEFKEQKVRHWLTRFHSDDPADSSIRTTWHGWKRRKALSKHSLAGETINAIYNYTPVICPESFLQPDRPACLMHCLAGRWVGDTHQGKLTLLLQET